MVQWPRILLFHSSDASSNLAGGTRSRRSSAGQSISLITRRSEVRALPPRPCLHNSVWPEWLPCKQCVPGSNPGGGSERLWSIGQDGGIRSRRARFDSSQAHHSQQRRQITQVRIQERPADRWRRHPLRIRAAPEWGVRVRPPSSPPCLFIPRWSKGMTPDFDSGN